LTEMGRERATDATPLTEPLAVQAAIELTRQARLALATSGSPPLERVPDVRPLLDRCRAAGSVLDGADLIQFIPVIDAAPRLTAYGHATRTASPGVATLTNALPRVPEVGDRLRLALDEAGAVNDDARLVEAIGELDWIFARAAAADRMGATPPALDAGHTVALKNARHPLLLAQHWRDPSRPVVPVDIELNAERPLLVLTGPNAGGKTIALKTTALLALMAQVGCHVPADEGSRLPVFTDLYALVGDEQSVAENLSTFSGLVKQIREVLETAGERSLVLLDELGAGTDPRAGAALAQAR